MVSILRILGYVAIPVLLISVGFTIRGIRREQQVAVTKRSSIIPMVLVAVTLIVYVMLLDVKATALATWLPLVAGVGAGLWWSNVTMRLTVTDGRVLGARTIWVLVPWAITLAITQGLALAESSLTSTVGFVALFAASGLTLGANGALLYRRNRLLAVPPPSAAAGTAATAALIALLVIGIPGTASAAGYSFEGIANGGEPSVTVDISGSGQGYYGDSISAVFTNNTGRTITVDVETGLRLVPADAAAQTMLTVGQTVQVPPGVSSRLLKAFCGEMHDRAPGAGDTFEVRGRADPAAVRSLSEVRRRNLADSSAAQDLIWFHTDGNNVDNNEIAQDILQSADKAPTREDAEKSAAATAVITAGVAAGLTGTEKRRLLTGSHALKQLTLRGAATRTIPVVDPETGALVDKVYVLPPVAPPDDTEAMAFTTKTITDPSTGEPVTVIDDGHEVQLLQKPLVPPAVTTAADKTETSPAAEATAAEAAKTGKKISEEEVKRIVDWGVKNNRTPDDIQHDVDARNETLGGGGTVPIAEPPKRITLPQGEVTLSPAEHAEFLRRANRMADLLDNARIYRIGLEKLQLKSRFWTAVDKAVIVRWIVGTKQIYDQGLIMNDPGPSMARTGGFDDVEQMLSVAYGKPTWMNYETHRYGSLTEAVAAWKQQPNGGWSQFQQDRSRAIDGARVKLKTMMAPLAKTGETPTLPERIFIGPNVEAPKELLPTSGPARNQMSWYNRPAHELSQIVKAQQQAQEYLRGVRLELGEYLEYEKGLADRIANPPD